MDYKQVSKEILVHVGGKENISHVEHCSTRLRLSLKDNSKVNKEEIEAIPGVLGLVVASQCQVIIGNDVVEVYDEFMKEIGALSEESSVSKEKQSFGNILLDFIVSVFQPLVPAIAGAGILKSLVLLVSMFGWLSDKGDTFKVLSAIGDAPIYFLPILVAITTANKLKVNTLVATSAVSILLLPAMTASMAEGLTLFGITIPNIAYASQVFPAILCVLFYAVMERFFKKYTPKATRIFVVPLLSLLVTIPVTLLVLGPIGFYIGSALSAVIVGLYAKVGWIAVALLAAISPFMVATGMHKAMGPYAVSSMTELGKELLYLPASLAHNLAEAGACFAVFFKSKEADKKSTALSAGISAVFGITEPALYGITILNKKVLGSVVFGGLVGGAYVGLTAIAAYVPVGPGLASMTMFVSKDAPSNIINAFIAFAISFVVAFVSAFILYKDDVIETQDESKDEKGNHVVPKETLIIPAPVAGHTIDLSQVPDQVFSAKIMGEGLAVIPSEDCLKAPVSGTIKMVFDTNHALGMELENGAELLFHIGLDTVQLQGKYFESLVKVEDYVEAGRELIRFDRHKIEEAGYKLETMMIVSNSAEYDVKTIGTDNLMLEVSEKERV